MHAYLLAIQVMQAWELVKTDFKGDDDGPNAIQVGGIFGDYVTQKSIHSITPEQLASRIADDPFLKGRVHLQSSRLRLMPNLIKVPDT